MFDGNVHPRYDEAVALSERSKVGAARSNPCFEVWLVLHETDFDRPGDRHAVLVHLCGLRSEYQPSGVML